MFCLQARPAKRVSGARGVVKRRSAVEMKRVKELAAAYYAAGLCRFQPTDEDPLAGNWEDKFDKEVCEMAVRWAMRQLKRRFTDPPLSGLRRLVLAAHAALVVGAVGARKRRGPRYKVSDEDACSFYTDLMDGRELVVTKFKYGITLYVSKMLYYESIAQWAELSDVVSNYMQQHQVSKSTIIKALYREHPSLAASKRRIVFAPVLTVKHKTDRLAYATRELERWAADPLYAELHLQCDEKKAFVSNELSKGHKVYGLVDNLRVDHPMVRKCGGGVAVNYFAATSYLWGPVFWQAVTGTTGPTDYKVCTNMICPDLGIACSR